MANPTTNYGFVMPTNTDLVKDLPADFDVFGQAVDTKIKDLNPETTAGDISYRGAVANAKTRLGIGTARQVLAVNAGATAPEWIASSTSTLTTTGDILYASAANTLARRAIGSNGDVLTVSGGLPTWAAPSASTESWSLIQTQNSTSGSTITFSNLGSYNQLYLLINNCSTAAATNDVYFDVNSSTGNNFVVGGNKLLMQSALSGNTTFAANGVRLTIAKVGAAATQLTGGIFLGNCKGTTQFKTISVHTGFTGETSDTGYNLNGICTLTSAITSISIIANGTTWDLGTMILYGSTV